MEALKANAIDFERQIDELRCVLIESVSKNLPSNINLMIGRDVSKCKGVVQWQPLYASVY
jgi:hypothetical protein